MQTKRISTAVRYSYKLKQLLSPYIKEHSMNWIIETENLGKRYGDVTAVEGLSLRVAEGEIYTFLGLNGAGKTTTIRMLLGMIKPSARQRHRAGETRPAGQPGALGGSGIPGGNAARLPRTDRAGEPGSRPAAPSRIPIGKPSAR